MISTDPPVNTVEFSTTTVTTAAAPGETGKKRLTAKPVFKNNLRNVINMYFFFTTVPNAFDGTFRLNDGEWTPALSDKESPEYQKLSESILSSLREAMPTGTLITIEGFEEGSIIVKYRSVSFSGAI